MIKGQWNTIHRCSSCSSWHCPGPHSCVLTLPFVLTLLPFVLSWPLFVPGPCSCSSSSYPCWSSPHVFMLLQPSVVLSWPLFVPALICTDPALIMCSCCPSPGSCCPGLCSSLAPYYAPSLTLTQPLFVCSHCPCPCLCVRAAPALICVLVHNALLWPSFVCLCCPGPHLCAHPVLICNTLVWPLFMLIWACLSVSNT